MEALSIVLFFLLNYFWLSDDPVESAGWYCDQHCFKIGSEVIESVWDAALALEPILGEEADTLGIAKTYRHRRHAKEGMLWHPLSVWNGLCRANLHRSLINADAIFAEHQRRTGKEHSAWQDCSFLLGKVDSIDFSSKRWVAFYGSQNGVAGTKHTPPKTKPVDLARRKVWCSVHAVVDGVDISKLDRNRCAMTTPPQCISEDVPEFKICRVPGDHIAAYRLYYHAKCGTVSGGMRYLYTSPPPWLKAEVKTERAGATKRFAVKTSPQGYLLDDEGYLVFELVGGKICPVKG
jgi:hypothetical protein